MLRDAANVKEGTKVIQALNIKVLELYYRARDVFKDENGQTSAEYVAVTAAAVGIAVSVIWVAFSGPLTDAIETIGENVNLFADEASSGDLPGGD